ncbi:MAG: tRNA dihydrouridine synthase DusB [Gammaproteobacteria bacterium]|nr:tRNA dihydrouridine synthase DusB [Gammaproteobacteria bacterium]
MRIGPYTIATPVVLAPMAGITDLPFRQLCRRFGVGLAVSEMVSTKPELQHSRKTLLRRNHAGEDGIRVVQIVGADATQMAAAARLNVAQGAQIIDINMGCPAKKVCDVAAGSALLRDEALVARILSAVVAAVDVPVTLKIRTGWDTQTRNGVQIARLAEACGIQALAVHGRTRACKFAGDAEYATIAEIKAAVRIPVIANGDIHSPQKARRVLAETGADAVMIGRAALGQPWLFQQISRYLDTNYEEAAPTWAVMHEVISEHMLALYKFYGEFTGVRMARKHLSWYINDLPGGTHFRQFVNGIEDANAQLAALGDYFCQQITQEGIAA